MIITCEKCSTSFNLDDSIVKQDGTKVRCSQCKHIFMAYPPQAEDPIPAPGIVPDVTPEIDVTPDQDPDPFFEPDNDDFFGEQDPDLPDLDLPGTDSFESDDSPNLEMDDATFEISEDDDDLDNDFSFDEAEPELTLESDDAVDETEPELHLELEDSESAPGLELEDTPSESDLELEVSDFEIEDDESIEDESGYDIDDDLTVEDHGLELDDSDYEIEDTGIEPAAIESDAIEPDGIDFELSDSEPNDSVDNFEAEDDFSFQSDNFKTTPDKDNSELELELDDSDDLKIELADDEPELDESLLTETDEVTSDEGFDFYAIPEDDPQDDLDEEIDEIEFEPILEEDDFDGTSIEEPDLELDVDSNDDDSNLALDTDDDEINEEEFELEFDYETSDDTEDDLTPPDTESLSIEDEPPMITPEDDFSEYDEVLEQETEPDDTLNEKETIEIDDSENKEDTALPKTDTSLTDKTAIKKEPSRKRHRRKQKKSGIGTPVLVLLLLFLLVAGAYIASIMTGYKIKYLSDIEVPYVKEFIEKYVPQKAPDTSDIKPVLNQKNVDGQIVSNSNAGNLFVITGRVENQSTIAYSHIEIKGTLNTEDMIEVKTKTVYCGNLITETMLKNGDIEEINKLLAVKVGRHDSNVNIKPGASVPFMVVFSDYPQEKLHNFIVRVHAFDRVTKTQSN